MALNAAIVWEVRTSGTDTNGGGFKLGASGTDFSQQDAAQFSGTNLSVDPASNTKVASATHNFVAADVGNVIQITAGVGWTTGFYEITAVGANEATLDRSPAAIGVTGGTWALGGALKSPALAAGAKVAGNDVWVKSGTYTVSVNTINVINGKVSDATGGVSAANPSRWEGYGTTRGDKCAGTTRPAITCDGVLTGLTLFLVSSANSFVIVDSMIADGNSRTTTIGFDFDSPRGGLLRCHAQNCTTEGMTVGATSGCFAFACSATTCGGTAGIIIGLAIAIQCEAYANTTHGFTSTVSGQASFVRCIASSNSGVSSDGFNVTNRVNAFSHCVGYGNGRHGFNFSGAATVAVNCVAEGNAGYGYTSTAGVNVMADMFNCAAFNNASGPVNATQLPNTMTGSITGTTSFFTNAAGGDFTLNVTAGGGALLRSLGYGALPRGLTVGYPDVGVAQHQDAARPIGPGVFSTGAGGRAAAY